MSKNIIFKGSGVALVTPMFDDGQINYDKLYDLIDFHIQNHSDAIIIAGTTGESATLNDNEYIEILEKTIEHANKKIPIIAGSGSNNTAKAITKSHQAKLSGADALLIVTPYYNKTSQAGLIKHFFSIAESVDLPIILYNVPSRTGLNIEPETYLKLSSHPNIVATKEASGDISSIAKIIELCKDNLTVYSGNDDQIIPCLSLGAKGVISVAANIIPQEIHDMCYLFFNNKINQATELQLKFLPLINTLFETINPIPIKQAMNLMNINVGKCRLPLSLMDDHKIINLTQTLKSYNLIK